MISFIKRNKSEAVTVNYLKSLGANFAPSMKVAFL